MAENVAPMRPAPTFSFSDLPDALVVSIFEVLMQEDPTWVRETFALINRACSRIFRTPQASPLHATVHVDFVPRGRGHLHAASAASWLAARAGDVRKLVIDIDMEGPDDGAGYTGEDVSAILRVVGPHLDELSVKVDHAPERPVGRPLWRTLSAVVAPAANLRSLRIDAAYNSDFDPSERDALALARLTSLEKLVFKSSAGAGWGTYLPAALCSCTGLRHLELAGHEDTCVLPPKSLLCGTSRCSPSEDTATASRGCQPSWALSRG